MKKYVGLLPGLGAAFVLALVSREISALLPEGLVGAGVIALLAGMAINPVLVRSGVFSPGLSFVSKKVLRLAIVLMGLGLSFTQVLLVGRFSLLVMTFTLAAAFGGGYLLGRLLGMDWKLSGLISAGTGICGGSAVAAIAPVIDAEDSYVAYAISATFIFDVVMVVAFPLMGRFFGMSDMGFGLWAGTAVNDTSSVVAAGYAFSDAAGQLATIVKLTRTLAIVPVVLIFSWISQRVEAKSSEGVRPAGQKVDLRKIFPWFILLFLVMVALKSTGLVPGSVSQTLGSLSKFLMVMSLGAIGLKTSFARLAKSGLTPMFHGFSISLLVVVVSFVVQMALGQV
mgnify:FL=1